MLLASKQWLLDKQKDIQFTKNPEDISNTSQHIRTKYTKRMKGFFRTAYHRTAKDVGRVMAALLGSE